MKPATLINPFIVPQEEEEKFLALWKEIHAYMKEQPGFIETKFHKSLDTHGRLPEPQFRFINVALWESPEAFAKVVTSNEFRSLAKDIMPYTAGPGFYEVIVE